MASPDITGAGEQTAAEVGDANGRVNHAAKSVETEETETAKFENIPVNEPEQKATDEDTVGQHVILSPKGRIRNITPSFRLTRARAGNEDRGK